MIIAQISDTHLLTLADEDKTKASRRIADFERAVAAVNALDPQPDVVLHTGDITQNALNAEYELAFEILSQLKAPVFATIGNRDERQPFYDVFSKSGYLSKRDDFIQYALEFEGLRLICGDSVSGEGPRGHICAKRMDGLRDMMGADHKRPALIFMHHPPVWVPPLRRPMQFISEDVAADFVQMASTFPHVGHVFCGHTHRADVIETSGPTISTMPAVATQLRLDSYPDALKEIPVFQVHDIQFPDPCSPVAAVTSRTILT